MSEDELKALDGKTILSMSEDNETVEHGYIILNFTDGTSVKLQSYADVNRDYETSSCIAIEENI